jgi:hypothetical protein
MPSDNEILRGYLIGFPGLPDSEWRYTVLMHTGEQRDFTWDGHDWVRSLP